jgi:BolA family transcriptional regulator, general stress-responsive regulator
MTILDRATVIRKRLQEAFSPATLEIIDDSAQHHGHAAAAGGAGYYTVVIKADIFKKMTRVEAHRAAYKVLNDMIPHEIHALQIKII